MRVRSEYHASALYIICSLFYCPPSHPSSHHPSLHRTLPRHGIFFWVWSGWQWGQLGYCDIVCWRNSEECFPLCPSSSHHLHSQPQQYGLCSTEFPSIHPQYHTITTHHGGRTYNGNPIQGMLILLLLNTSLSTHINMTHARDFYLPWYWAVGSGCFADIDIIFFAIAARCIIYYLFYCPPFTPIIPSSIIASCTDIPRHDIVFWVCGGGGSGLPKANMLG